MALGAGQRLSNGNYVFTSGFQGQPPNIFGQSIEVRPDGSKAYVLQVNQMEYRSFRMGTLYKGISDQLAGDGGREVSQHGDDSGSRSRRNQQGENGAAGVSFTATRSVSDDFGPAFCATLSTSVEQPPIPAGFPLASSISATAAPPIPIGETGDGPAVPDLPAVAAAAARDASFADAGSDPRHEGPGDDLALALSP
jgi:hypothetical protein